MTRSPGRRTMAAVALGAWLTLAGCGAADAPSASDTSGRDTTVQPTDDADPTPNESTTSPDPTTQPGGSTDPGAPPEASDQPPASSGGVVDLALQDLANRLGVGIDEITVSRNDEVTWRDGSLGCAEKGRAYVTMLVAGHLVLLESGGKSYEYHAGKGQAPFLCENPQPPLPASAGG